MNIIMDKLKIATFNVRGLADHGKRRKIFYYLNSHEYDVVFLQETHSVKNAERRWRAEYGGRIIFSHGTNNARGVAILIRKKAPIKVIHQMTDQEGRMAIVQTKIENNEINLVNLYVPNTDYPKFFTNTFEHVANIKSSNSIIGGDWNLVLNIEKDKKGGRQKTHPKSTLTVKTYMDVDFMTDIWRFQHPETMKYTWGLTNRNKIYERLDFFIVSDEIVDNITYSDIAPAFISDHAIPYIIYKIGSQKRGPGF